MSKRTVPSGSDDERESIEVSSNESFGELWIMQKEFLGSGDTPDDHHYISIKSEHIDALIEAIQEVRAGILFDPESL